MPYFVFPQEPLLGDLEGLLYAVTMCLQIEFLLIRICRMDLVCIKTTSLLLLKSYIYNSRKTHKILIISWL